MPQGGGMRWHPWEDLRALVELGAPSACAGCGLAGRRWCPDCARSLEEGPPGPWSPTPRPAGMPATWSGAAYADRVRTAVVAWKDGGRADLTTVLAPRLRGILAAALAGSPEHLAVARSVRGCPLVPAPSARSGTRARGEHRVAALARAAASGHRAHLPVVDGLRLRRAVSDQARLTAAERAANLSGAVTVTGAGSRAVQGRPCIVVDDVVTTGATLAECARALLAAGSGPVVAVTLAATRRRVDPSLSSVAEAD